MNSLTSLNAFFLLLTFPHLHRVFDVDHFCWLINSMFLCSINSPHANVKLPGIKILMTEVAPENTLQFLLDRYKGKTVFIDLWATWCVPCIEGQKAMGSPVSWLQFGTSLKFHSSFGALHGIG